MMAAPESLKNFFALTWQSPRPPVVKRIEVSYGLQHELTDLFDAQAHEFLDGEPKSVPFDGRYQVDDSEISVISPFMLVPEIVEAVTHSHLLEKLDPERDDLSQIRSIFASSHGSGGVNQQSEFQGFDRSRLLGYKFSILGRRGVSRKLDETGLALDTKLAALFEGNTL